ncbi:hypothetical protein [Erythrobacter sp. BLCC-B19]|uniref:hypothetical protein n=1 Tax=Erythrobacter sp. BLCC-B19 TaxID=3025315 RepID=UPI00235E79DD|nr:hypothetical protein [Erythrobacter sp. BLCC-B19]WDA41169.1 hypothetical protein PS060_16720 [Erythrobacter sp. BLCC-B19]
MLLTLAFGLVLTLGLSALSGWQTYSAPIGCADSEGHGPDPGTRECEAAIQHQIENRSKIIREGFLAPIPWCLALLAFVLSIQGLTMRLRSRGIEF